MPLKIKSASGDHVQAFVEPPLPPRLRPRRSQSTLPDGTHFPRPTVCDYCLYHYWPSGTITWTAFRAPSPEPSPSASRLRMIEPLALLVPAIGLLSGNAGDNLLSGSIQDVEQYTLSGRRPVKRVMRPNKLIEGLQRHSFLSTQFRSNRGNARQAAYRDGMPPLIQLQELQQESEAAAYICRLRNERADSAISWSFGGS